MKYGLTPDVPDTQDYIYKLSGLPLKTSNDLRLLFPPCWDQGKLGQCTGEGISGIVAFVHGFIGSPLWLYYKEREMEGSLTVDSGAQIRDGIKIVASLGLASLESWPEDLSKWLECPPDTVNEGAKLQIATEYYRLAGPSDFKDCLSVGHPIVIGLTLHSSFEGPDVASTGIVPMPVATDTVLGGHCIVIVGYTEAGDWICRNSWGPNWGLSGYFILPKAYLDDMNLWADAWMIVKINNT